MREYYTFVLLLVQKQKQHYEDQIFVYGVKYLKSIKYLFNMCVKLKGFIVIPYAAFDNGIFSYKECKL